MENRLFPGSLVPLFQSESKCDNILIYENDFVLHENKTACNTHFHMRGFTLRLFLKRVQENSEMHYYTILLQLKQNLKLTCLNEKKTVLGMPCTVLTEEINFVPAYAIERVADP